MNLAELRTEAYLKARENSPNEEDKFWSKEEMDSYINRVYRTIARETKCIKDSYTPAVCRITVAPPVNLAALEAAAVTDIWAQDDLEGYNDEFSWLYQKLVAPRSYALHKAIIDIDECKWKNKPWKLNRVSVVKWQQNPWWEKVSGYPTEFCTDYHNKSLSLNYRTNIADTLLLSVRRLPLVDLIEEEDEPEFRSSYHDFMLNGILEQMYSKQDSEVIDLKKAAEYALAFKADIDEIKQQETIFDQRLKVNHSMNAFR